MNDARIARHILEAIEVLNDLLWDRFGDQITQIYREEQQNQPCSQLGPSASNTKQQP